jgi:hypothetical protein
MILMWSPFKIVSVSAVLYPRWPPLLKIEISSNIQNCSVLNQNVPKCELYKHNDEFVNIHYGIFYELWTFADFDRLCKLGINKQKSILKSSCQKPLGQFQPSFVWMILRWSPFKIVSGSSILFPRWLLLPKIQMPNGQICCIWSHDWLKFVLYEHNYVLFSSPGHRPYELLPSGFVRHPLSVRRRLSLAFHILIFSSENTEPI